MPLSLDTSTEIEIYGRRVPFAPRGTPDPGDGDTDIETSTGFSEHETGGPILPTDGDTTIEILPGFFRVSPPGPLPILDPPDSTILTGLNLFVPEDVEIPSNVVDGPGGTLFVKPIEENPDGAMSLPAVNQTEEVTIGDGIINRSPPGLAPLPAVNESVEVDLQGPVLRFAPAGITGDDTPEIENYGNRLQLAPEGMAADDTPEVEIDGKRYMKDSAGVFGNLAIDQTTTVEIHGRMLNFGN
jgi:hypothetical protein